MAAKGVGMPGQAAATAFQHGSAGTFAGGTTQAHLGTAAQARQRRCAECGCRWR
jgi:hypothetical protein